MKTMATPQAISKSTLKTENPVEVIPVRQVKVLLEWQAPIRAFKKRNRDFWTTVVSIVFLLAIILIFIKEWLLLAVIISLVFVYYVLSSVAPEKVEHQITTRGVRFVGREYLWDELTQYWITKRWEERILNLQLKSGLPGKLELLLGEVEEKRIREILDKYLLAEAPPPSFLDKASVWLIKKVPLEIN